MKFTQLTSIIYLVTFAASAPPALTPESNSLSVRDNAGSLDSYSPLEKRKGGGGKGGASSGSSGGRTSTGANTGGRTSAGSGTPYYSGGRYAGGSATPYTSGPTARSPSRGILPFALPIAGLAIFPGLWLYSSLYAYPWGYGYHWYGNGRNYTSNVTCLCQQYSVCGCDPNDDTDFLQKLISNGTDHPVNTTMVSTIQYPNGTYASFINGTLDNGTTAPGGTDDDEEDESAASSLSRSMNFAGYWVAVVLVVIGIMS